MSPIIEVQDLTKRFSDRLAVDHLSFTVNPGDIYGFLGQNGAGKSTTIRMLLSLIQPSSGAISLLGKNLFQHPSEILRRVGAVIEKPDMYKYLSAYDNLSIFAKLSGLDISRQRINDQLEMVGLLDRAQSKVKTFSQGMKQRLGIAIALVNNPYLIILDEPTNGLDPQGIADIRNLIISLSKDKGKTILVSSHLLSEIELIANRMIIIHNGKKIVEGEVAELLDPEKTYVTLVTTDNPKTLSALQSTTWKSRIQSSDSEQIQLQMNRKHIPQLVNDLVKLNVQVLSVESSHSLEQYFLSLTTQSHDLPTIAN